MKSAWFCRDISKCSRMVLGNSSCQLWSPQWRTSCRCIKFNYLLTEWISQVSMHVVISAVWHFTSMDLYWLCVGVTLNIVRLLLLPCMLSKLSLGFNILQTTFSFKIEAIFILSKLQGCWFWAQQLAGQLEKLRFDKFSVQVWDATIIFDFVGVCPEGAILNLKITGCENFILG